MKKPIDGRCNAKKRSGDPCTQYPVKGRARCRMHGGATPRGRASVHFKHGLFSKYRDGERAVGELSTPEQRKFREYQAMTAAKAAVDRRAMDMVIQDRAVEHGNLELAIAAGVSVSSAIRAEVVAMKDRGQGVQDLPEFIEVFEGKTRDDFRREHQERTRDVLAAHS